MANINCISLISFQFEKTLFFTIIFLTPPFKCFCLLLFLTVGSSDPLPFIIDIRGLLTNLVVDRAVTLASHGFAVFAFDYFLPRRLKSQEENVYIDSQAFIVSGNKQTAPPPYPHVS